ncbi:MAG: methionine--tRNA ligase [Herbinix sp.]|jgi:methionyl-tRNA synthetase|nr:methionine--tRNA ligase [Herbinix sp.]
MSKYILIGGAWPYANGSLHIGHIAALLPGDVIARYHRAIGNKVVYVSGSDCHGTPVTIRAIQEHKTPKEISDQYHDEFDTVFQKLGFRYDLYGKTSSDSHKKFVTDFHQTLYQSQYVYEKTIPQVYCNHCMTFLTDRNVIGTCPDCGAAARGDQCDGCGTVLEAGNLLHPKCQICGENAVYRETTHLYIAISRLEEELRNFLEKHPHWRKNAIAFTRRYIEEGLRDRAITRDLNWGIEVPFEGYEDKKIYIWAENVLGYLSMSYEVCKEKGYDFNELWGEQAKHYYIHGKDNIPFHTIILPSLLLAHGGPYRLPDEIISSEYLTLEGRKISTSQNWAIWAKDIVDRYDTDSLRYFFIANGPEKRDTDFSWHEYFNNHNSELLGAYGNFVSRTLIFVQKYFEGLIPTGILEEEIKDRLQNLYINIGDKIDQGNLKDALNEVFDFIRLTNKYYDTWEPWKTRNDDISQCKQTIYTCVQIIANLAVVLSPFLPISSEKLSDWLNLSDQWELQSVPEGYTIPEIGHLFERLDKKMIEEELSKLK